MCVSENVFDGAGDLPLLSWSAEAGQVCQTPEIIDESYDAWKDLMAPERVIEEFLAAPIVANLNDLKRGQVLDMVSRSEPVSYPDISGDESDTVCLKVSKPVEQIVRITRTETGLVGEFWDISMQEQSGESFSMEQLHGCDKRAPLLGQTVVREGAYLAGTIQFEGIDPYERWLFGPIRECCVIDYDDPRLTTDL